MLMIRQYQRYILEEFLKCFELAVLAGCRSLNEIADHPTYIGAISLEDDGEEGCGPALRMLARWWFGSVIPLTAQTNSELATLGGEDRISMRWFLRWLEGRLDMDLHRFVTKVYEQLVFAQHVRVALSRFDDQGQRLRFTLGDERHHMLFALIDVR